MTCGIYKLVFKETDKVYVGQSINIEKRYKDHVRNVQKSIKMQEAFKTYGTPNLIILDTCELDKLDELEIHYIDKFDSYNNGFNSTTGGVTAKSERKYDDEVYIGILLSLCDIDKSFMDIAIEYNVSYTFIRRIYNQESHLWLKNLLPDEYKIAINLKRSNSERASKYSGVILIGPDDSEYDVENIADLIKEFGLDVAGLYRVLSGKRNHHKGFRLKYPLDGPKETTKYFSHTVISPEGKSFVIPPRGKAGFCREHGLRVESLTKLLNGITKEYKGWTLP